MSWPQRVTTQRPRGCATSSGTGRFTGVFIDRAADRRPRRGIPVRSGEKLVKHVVRIAREIPEITAQEPQLCADPQCSGSVV